MIKGTIEDNIAKFDTLEFEASNMWACQFKKKERRNEERKKTFPDNTFTFSLFSLKINNYFYWPGNKKDKKKKKTVLKI